MPLERDRRSLASVPALPRRGFLGALAALPLVGGGLTLVGAPTAAAVPVSPFLLDRYMDFLAIEWRETVIQSREIAYAQREPENLAACGDGHIRRHVEDCMWAPERPEMRALLDANGRPSSRAAVILSAAGVPLVGGHHA